MWMVNNILDSIRYHFISFKRQNKSAFHKRPLSNYIYIPVMSIYARVHSILCNLVILSPIFLVLVSSTKFPFWQSEDQNLDAVFRNNEQDEPIPTENLRYGNPLMGGERNNDYDKYEYYWSFVSNPEDEKPTRLSNKNKKNYNSKTTLCMSLPRKREPFPPEDGYDYEPSAVTQYACESLPPQVFDDLNNLDEKASVCKVKGECQTITREISVYKKKKSCKKFEEPCWHKVKNFEKSVGCLCLNHIYH